MNVRHFYIQWAAALLVSLSIGLNTAHFHDSISPDYQETETVKQDFTLCPVCFFAFQTFSPPDAHTGILSPVDDAGTGIGFSISNPDIPLNRGRSPPALI